MSWVTSKIITRISLVSSLLRDPTSAILSKGNTPKFGSNRGGVTVLSRKPALSLKQSKIWPRLLLMANMKRHVHFRLVPKSITLHDLERPLHFFKTHAFSEPTTKIWMKIDLHYRRRTCSPLTVVSGSIRFMWIFVGVPWRGGIRRQWGCQKQQFSLLSLAISSEPLEVKPTLLYIVI